jgi:hypothetical protein
MTPSPSRPLKLVPSEELRKNILPTASSSKTERCDGRHNGYAKGRSTLCQPEECRMVLRRC